MGIVVANSGSSNVHSNKFMVAISGESFLRSCQMAPTKTIKKLRSTSLTKPQMTKVGVFLSGCVLLLFFVTSARAGVDLIGSLDISFASSGLRVADVSIQNNFLEFNYVLRSAATKKAIVARATFDLESKDFQTVNQLNYENVKSADVYEDEHIIVFEDNTVFQSNNGTTPIGIAYQKVSPDNLCAFGYEKYDGFAYTHISSSQPFMTSNLGFGKQLGGEGDPGGIACKSLTEERVFIFATSNVVGFAKIFNKNGTEESLTSSNHNYQKLVRPTTALNGDYILYCANNGSSSQCYDNKDYTYFSPTFLNARVLSLAATVQNSEIVLAGFTLNSSLVILTYDNNRKIVDMAENKGVYSWDHPTSAVATSKYLVVAFSYFKPSTSIIETRIEIYEKNDKIFVPPTSFCHRYSYNWTLLLLVLLVCFASI